MVNTKQLASYRTVAVDTASPGKLVLMLFDGALRFLDEAETGCQLPEGKQRVETVHNNLIKVQNIVQELQRCLDLRAGGEFAQNMFRIYDFMQTRLMEANVRKEPDNMQVVRKLLLDIRGAWNEMLNAQSAEMAPSMGLSFSA